MNVSCMLAYMQALSIKLISPFFLFLQQFYGEINANNYTTVLNALASSLPTRTRQRLV